MLDSRYQYLITCFIILDLSLEFDEYSVLEDNRDYLVSTLQLEGIDIEYSDKASEKTQEECRPGAPFIVFRVDPSIELTFINDEPHTGNLNDCIKSTQRSTNTSKNCIKHQFLKNNGLIFRPLHNNMSYHGK